MGPSPVDCISHDYSLVTLTACNPIICLVLSDNYRNCIKRAGKRLKWKRTGRYNLKVSSARDHSRSNIQLLNVRVLRPGEGFKYFGVTLNLSLQYGENRV